MGDDTPKADLIQKESHNVLHATTPSENLAIYTSVNRSEEVVKRVHSFQKCTSENHAKKEEVSEKPNRGKGIQSEDKIQGTASNEKTPTQKPNRGKGIQSEDKIQGTSSNEKTPTPSTSNSPPPVASETKPRSPGNSNRNAKTHNSEIISPKDESNLAASIFSVNGAPSRKVYHKRERTPNNVFPTDDPPYDKPSTSKEVNKNKEQKRPSSSVRNPLTGTGLTSNDEYKFNKTVKRKDGNPLLGIGYTPETPHSSHRIPPGGYSHKLW